MRKKRRSPFSPQTDDTRPSKGAGPALKPFDLDRVIAEWTRGLRRSEALEDGAIAELAAHVRDEIEDLIGQGRSPQEAFGEVTGSLEGLDMIGAEYHKTRARGLLAPPSPRAGLRLPDIHPPLAVPRGGRAGPGDRVSIGGLSDFPGRHGEPRRQPSL
jgi:hypothetical protein